MCVTADDPRAQVTVVRVHAVASDKVRDIRAEQSVQRRSGALVCPHICVVVCPDGHAFARDDRQRAHRLDSLLDRIHRSAASSPVGQGGEEHVPYAASTRSTSPPPWLSAIRNCSPGSGTDAWWGGPNGVGGTTVPMDSGAAERCKRLVKFPHCPVEAQIGVRT